MKALYERFLELGTRCGSVKLAPTKTRIGSQARMIFAAVSLRENCLDCHVVFWRRLENPRFVCIESLTPRIHVHHFRIQSGKKLDYEVASWLQEAYKVGE